MRDMAAENRFNTLEHYSMRPNVKFFAKIFVKILVCIVILLIINLSIVHADDDSATVPDSTSSDDSGDESGGSTSLGDIKDSTNEIVSSLDTVLDTLSSLTCETQGIGNLLRAEFTHTCVPEPFLTFLVANIVSPGLYANTLLRVAINDEELFPGACLRENRVEYDDLKLSFGMCSNTKLAIARIAAIAGVGVTIAQTLFTGENVWDAILGTWNLPKDQYYEMFLDKKENDEGMMVDIGVIPVFPWKIIREKDKLCVATQDITLTNWIPVGCKYIKEPYPTSIYADFLNVTGEPLDDAHSELKDLTSLTTCSNMGGCYQRAYSNSRASIVVSGPIIECVKEMVAKMMISTSVCSFDDVRTVLGSEARRSSAFFQFQKNMHRIVSALLTIYIILFGFKVILAGDVPPKSEIMNFLIKFIFVVYFSVGINIHPGGDEDTERLDGMIQWAIPFLMNGMDDISSWAINANPSNFCNFSDVDYPQGLSHLRIWDALDCRVMNYLGLDTLMMVIGGNIISNNNTIEDPSDNTDPTPPAAPAGDSNTKDNLKYNIPPFIMLIVPAILSGMPILALLCLTFPIFVISFMALMINATVVCIISIVVLAVLAPLFVPMYLFDVTKGYFEAWLKLLISFMLQPLVIVTFMTLMMALNDRSFNGTCEYQYSDVQMGDPEDTTDINVMGINFSDGFLNDGRTFRYFYSTYDWSTYNSEEDIEGCKSSLSYFFKQLASLNFENAFSTSDSNSKTGSTNNIDSPIVKKQGMFFSTFELVFEKIRGFAIALIAMYLVSWLMTKFSDTVVDFAADMTEGVSLAKITVKPATIQAAFNKVIKGVAGAAVRPIGGGAKGMATKGAKSVGNKLKDKGVNIREGALKKIKKAAGAIGDAGHKVTGGKPADGDKISKKGK